MKQFQITINDINYSVEILDDPRLDEVQVRVNGEDFIVRTGIPDQAAPATTPVQAKAPTPMATSPSARDAQQSTAVGTGTIKAPLPGVINSIAVRSGQSVKANDEICVIEAMKAMNIIRAPRDGVVGRVYVDVGAQIAYGAPLLDIE